MGGQSPYDLDVVAFDVLEQTPVIADAPAPVPQLDDRAEAIVFASAS